MSTSELQRLAQDAKEQPALRDKLHAELTQCSNAEESSALFKKNGYDISVEDISAGEPLSDETLDQVTGGVGPKGQFLIAFRRPIIHSEPALQQGPGETN